MLKGRRLGTLRHDRRYHGDFRGARRARGTVHGGGVARAPRGDREGRMARGHSSARPAGRGAKGARAPRRGEPGGRQRRRAAQARVAGMDPARGASTGGHPEERTVHQRGGILPARERVPFHVAPVRRAGHRAPVADATEPRG